MNLFGFFKDLRKFPMSISRHASEKTFVRFLYGFVKFCHNWYLLKKKSDIILLSHFGLGDQLIIGNLINNLSINRHVTLPVDEKYFQQIKDFYSYNSNLHVVSIGYLEREFYPRKNDLKELRDTFNLPILDVGRNVIFFLSFVFRKAGVSKLYYLAGWNSGKSFENFPAYLYHYENQALVGNEIPYAFIDHHPGTNREIPNAVLDEIRDKGLDLKFNDTEVSLIDQLSTIVNARELHFVASAPFCLALVLPCKAIVKVFYETKNSVSTLGEEGAEWRRLRCI